MIARMTLGRVLLRCVALVGAVVFLLSEARRAFAESRATPSLIAGGGDLSPTSGPSPLDGSAELRGNLVVAVVWAEGCNACGEAVGPWLLAIERLRRRDSSLRVLSVAATMNAPQVPLVAVLRRLDVPHARMIDGKAYVAAAQWQFAPATLVIFDGCVMGGVEGRLAPRRFAAVERLVTSARSQSGRTRSGQCTA